MKILCFFTLILFLAASPVPVAGESCVECHTDQSIMSSLVEMPARTGDAGYGSTVGPAGAGIVLKQETYYKRYLIDRNAINGDPHLGGGCVSCHKGDGKSSDREKAHKGIVKRPSEDLKVCSDCHTDIVKNYQGSLHYTVRGLLSKVSGRFSGIEARAFSEKVFGRSCKSCHAACGDCHVSSPAIDGKRSGFLKGHAFVKKDEGKTCAVCHGGRVYTEYTGKFGAVPDVHYRKGMACTDCHKKDHLHGDGNAYGSRDETKRGPKCRDCHKTGMEKKPTAKLAHSKHEGRVSCYGCHVQGEYQNCYGCHNGRASSKGGFTLGADPANKKVLTTLRSIPVSRDSFMKEGIKMEQFDLKAGYSAAPVHKIQRITARTRSCDVCHISKKGFLTKGSLIKNGPRADEGLIFRMPPLDVE